MIKGKRILSVITLFLILCALGSEIGVFAENNGPETLFYFNADDTQNEIGENQGFVITKNSGKDGGDCYKAPFTVSQTYLAYLPWLTSKSLTMNPSKKYIFHSDYYPDFDTPTGYVENLCLNPSSAINRSGMAVTPKSGTHPTEYRYYSYYYANDYTDLYTTGFFSGITDDNLKVSDSAVWPPKTNEMRLKTKEWNTYELLISKPPENSSFSVYPYVHNIAGNDAVGKYMLIDNTVMQELALKQINLKRNNSSVNNTAVKTKQNFSIDINAEVFNQFDTELGFKDKEGRVLEPLRFKIYNEKNELVSVSDFENTPENAEIYVKTIEQAYDLKAPKDGKTQWICPTYSFEIITASSVECGRYKIYAELLNKDIHSADQTVSFDLDVISENQITGDEKEPETLIWMNGEDEENKIGISVPFSENGGKDGTGGYYYTFDSTSENMSYLPTFHTPNGYDMKSDKKYIYHADYYAELGKTGEYTNNWNLNPSSNAFYINTKDGESAIRHTKGGELTVSNEDYRYYSVYNDANGDDIYTTGFYSGSINGGKASYQWGVSNQFELPKNEWTTFEMMINKPSGGKFSITPFVCKYLSQDDTDGKKLYMDNIYLQELSLGEIKLSKTEATVVRNHEIEFTAEVYNQFGTELGFKDKEGRTLEPLKFEVYDPFGEKVSENVFSVSDTDTEDKDVYVTTEKQSVALTSSDGSFVYPTYKFTLCVNSGVPLGYYKVVASLQNKDIHNSDKTVELTVKVTEENSVPSGNSQPETLMWANGDDVSCGSLGNPVKNIGVNGTNGYKLTFYKDRTLNYLTPIISTMERRPNPNKKYIYHGDYYIDCANGEKTSNWFLNPTQYHNKEIKVTQNGGTPPDNSEYRYYSYYPFSSDTDLYTTGFFSGTVYDDLSCKDMGWYPVTNQFELYNNRWNTYEMLITKPDTEHSMAVYTYVAPSSEDPVEGKQIYVDNLAFQELALGAIAVSDENSSLNGITITLKRGEQKSFRANVYNQFGSELGFKDKHGRTLEPLKFTIYNESGQTVSDNIFSIDENADNTRMSIKTEKLVYSLKAPKDGREEWVCPTYSYTLSIPKNTPCGSYRIVASLQNDDIFGSEKTEEFYVAVLENENAKDIEIAGTEEIQIPAADEICYRTYTADAAGTWTLDSDCSGVSISNDGILSVMPFAKSGYVNIVFSSENYLSSKLVKLIPNVSVSIDKEREINVDFNEKELIYAAYGKDGSLKYTELLKNPQMNGSVSIKADYDVQKAEFFIWDKMTPKSEKHVLDIYNETAYEIFVSPDGDDLNFGDISAPLKTLEGARNKIREIRKNCEYPKKGFTVNLREGTYSIKQTFILEGADSGEKDNPIVYRAYNGEKVTVSGGEKLPSYIWNIVTDNNVLSVMPESARGHVYEADLGALGYTRQQIGEMNYWGSYSSIPAYQPDTFVFGTPSELFCDDEPMTVARYPDNNEYIKIPKLYEAGTAWFYDQSTKIPFEIGYDDPETERWLNAKYAKLCGFWQNDWAQSSVDIAKIDTEKKSITSRQPVAFACKAWDDTRVGGRYYIYNLLEELSVPGEYYIDLDSMKLYYYPKGDIRESELVLSFLKAYLMEINYASNIVFEGISFAHSRYSGIQMNYCNNCVVSDCEIKNLGKIAVNINNGENNSVKNCKIYNTDGGIDLNSRDKMSSLEKSNNSAVGNEIFNYSRKSLCYNPAVLLQGCGNYVANNVMHDAPHLAITLQNAAENTVEYNEIYGVLKDTSDAGAIYFGMAWQMQGNVFRYNYIHDIGKNQEHLSAIYLDGTVGGAEIYSNIIGNFYGNGIYINGGSDVSVHDNVLYNCGKYGLLMTYVTNMAYLQESESQYGQLKASPFKTDIWKEKYPHLYDRLDGNPYLPKYDEAYNNITVDCTENLIYDAVKELGNITVPVEVSDGTVKIDAQNGSVSVDFEAVRQLIPSFSEIDTNKIGKK